VKEVRNECMTSEFHVNLHVGHSAFSLDIYDKGRLCRNVFFFVTVCNLPAPAAPCAGPWESRGQAPGKLPVPVFPLHLPAFTPTPTPTLSEHLLKRRCSEIQIKSLTVLRDSDFPVELIADFLRQGPGSVRFTMNNEDVLRRTVKSHEPCQDFFVVGVT